MLVDSGDAVERVWREWAVEHGIDPDEVARASHGVPSPAVVARVAPHLSSAEEIDRIERRHAATGGTRAPGRRRAAGLRRAVVTSCSPPLAAARLGAAGLPTPDVLITSDATARGKPHPDPYLAAAAALGADPGDCLVIEDAPAGIAAARAAGMTVWAVTTTHARMSSRARIAFWRVRVMCARCCAGERQLRLGRAARAPRAESGAC